MRRSVPIPRSHAELSRLLHAALAELGWSDVEFVRLATEPWSAAKHLRSDKRKGIVRIPYGLPHADEAGALVGLVATFRQTARRATPDDRAAQHGRQAGERPGLPDAAGAT